MPLAEITGSSRGVLEDVCLPESSEGGSGRCASSRVPRSRAWVLEYVHLPESSKGLVDVHLPGSSGRCTSSRVGCQGLPGEGGHWKIYIFQGLPGGWRKVYIFQSLPVGALEDVLLPPIFTSIPILPSPFHPTPHPNEHLCSDPSQKQSLTLIYKVQSTARMHPNIYIYIYIYNIYTLKK